MMCRRVSVLRGVVISLLISAAGLSASALEVKLTSLGNDHYCAEVSWGDESYLAFLPDMISSPAPIVIGHSNSSTHTDIVGIEISANNVGIPEMEEFLCIGHYNDNQLIPGLMITQDVCLYKDNVCKAGLFYAISSRDDEVIASLSWRYSVYSDNVFLFEKTIWDLKKETMRSIRREATREKTPLFTSPRKEPVIAAGPYREPAEIPDLPKPIITFSPHGLMYKISEKMVIFEDTGDLGMYVVREINEDGAREIVVDAFLKGEFVMQLVYTKDYNIKTWLKIREPGACSNVERKSETEFTVQYTYEVEGERVYYAMTAANKEEFAAIQDVSE